MCRLFGFRSSVLSRAHRSLIAAENALATQALAHPHGWGIGYFAQGEAYVIKSEHGAAGSESFRRAADRLASNALVAHVRRATVGSVDSLNTHPFRNGRWIFAHNGTLFGFCGEGTPGLEDRLAAATPADLWQRRLGTTDTEAFFCFLLGILRDRGVDPEGGSPIDPDAVSAAVVEAVGRVVGWAEELGVAEPVVNFLLTNGRAFFAHRRGRELFFSTQKLLCRDALTCSEPDKPCLLRVRPHDRVNHLLVASERIGDEDVWEEVPEQTLLALGEDFRLRSYATA